MMQASPLLPTSFSNALGIDLDVQRVYESTKVPKDITPNDLLALAQFKQLVTAEDMEWVTSPKVLGPGGDFKIIRFLRASSYDTRSCLNRLSTYAAFRHLWRLDSLTVKDVQADLIAHQYFYLPDTHRFKSGDRVTCLHLAYHDELPSFERIYKTFLYVCEKLDTELADSFDQAGYIVSFNGYKLKHYTHRYERTIVDLITYLYPERASASFAVHAPLFIRMLYKIASGYIPRELRRCIVVVASPSHLDDIIDHSVLPRMFGGASDYDATDFVRDRSQAEAMMPSTLHEPHPILSEALNGLGLPCASMATGTRRVVLLSKAKKRVTTGRWKRYVLVLTRSALFYYENWSTPTPNNGILLCMAKLVNAPSHVLRTNNQKRVMAIHYDFDSRVYEFSFKTKDLANTWREGVKQCIAEAQTKVRDELRAKVTDSN